MAEAMDNMDSLNMETYSLREKFKGQLKVLKSYHNYNKYILF